MLGYGSTGNLQSKSCRVAKSVNDGRSLYIFSGRMQYSSPDQIVFCVEACLAGGKLACQEEDV